MFDFLFRIYESWRFSYLLPEWTTFYQLSLKPITLPLSPDEVQELAKLAARQVGGGCLSEEEIPAFARFALSKRT